MLAPTTTGGTLSSPAKTAAPMKRSAPKAIAAPPAAITSRSLTTPSRNAPAIFLSRAVSGPFFFSAAQAGDDAVLDGQQVLEAEQVVEELPEAVLFLHALLGREQEQGIGDVDHEHRRGLEPRNGAVPGEQAEQGGGREHDVAVAADHLLPGAHGRQDAGQAGDQQHVGHDGADDRAQDQAALALESCRQRRGELGHGGPQGHQGQADDEIRYAELFGERSRRLDEMVGSFHQQQQTEPKISSFLSPSPHCIIPGPVAPAASLPATSEALPGIARFTVI